MPDIGIRVHELRITDGNNDWRIFYRLDADRVLIISLHQEDAGDSTARHKTLQIEVRGV